MSRPVPQEIEERENLKPFAAIQIPKQKSGFSPLLVTSFVAASAILGFAVFTAVDDNAVSAAPSKPVVVEKEVATAKPKSYEAPTGLSSKYTSTGASISWQGPKDSTELATFRIEFSFENKPWQQLSSVAVDELTVELTKFGVDGTTSYRVVAVYKDGAEAISSAIKLPGEYS